MMMLIIISANWKNRFLQPHPQYHRQVPVLIYPRLRDPYKQTQNVFTPLDPFLPYGSAQITVTFHVHTGQKQIAAEFNSIPLEARKKTAWDTNPLSNQQ